MNEIMTGMELEQEVFEDGEEACRAGILIKENPYLPQSQFCSPYVLWERGWENAYTLDRSTKEFKNKNK